MLVSGSCECERDTVDRSHPSGKKAGGSCLGCTVLSAEEQGRETVFNERFCPFMKFLLLMVAF